MRQIGCKSSAGAAAAVQCQRRGEGYGRTWLDVKGSEMRFCSAVRKRHTWSHAVLKYSRGAWTSLCVNQADAERSCYHVSSQASLGCKY